MFGKQDDIRGHILDNELIALQPNSFKTIQQFFTKFKSLALPCKKCGIERKVEQHVLSILNKLGYEYSVFISTFHSKIASILNWKMTSVDMFVESLIQEKDKLVQMGML